jgi:hypothetical protein
MAKKTARATAKPSQSKTKEEQWRRRMAQQSQAGAGSVLAEPDMPAEVDDVSADGETVPAAPRRATASAAGARRSASASAALAQRASASARNVRSRLSTVTLSLDQEMGYIRTDIRKLIVLTLSCIVILVALAFIVPSFIK